MPIRVRWDIDFQGRYGRAKRIARRIHEASPLIVELRIDGEKGLAEFPAIFTEIHKNNPRIETTLPLDPDAVAAARWGYPMDFIWEVKALQPFRRRLPPDAEAISFVPDEDNLSHLADIIEEFAESGARTLHLPNINAVRSLASVGHVPIAGAGALQDAARSLSSLRISLEGKKLVAHDYFLWRILRHAFPAETGGRVEFSGCQAASALAYVDWEGSVYPCDSLPIRLGNLQDTKFEKIWNAPARRRVLEAIRSVPGACEPCDQRDACLSGCRGLAYHAAGTLNAPDPACPEPTVLPPK
ncbi:MAG: SPASM domain-containing protein [Deltaproteobacteria bacterium]|nr:SPASM domain-containing protein [Deltaproteobacteria bacterium]